MNTAKDLVHGRVQTVHRIDALKSEWSRFNVVSLCKDLGVEVEGENPDDCLLDSCREAAVDHAAELVRNLVKYNEEVGKIMFDTIKVSETLSKLDELITSEPLTRKRAKVLFSDVCCHADSAKLCSAFKKENLGMEHMQ